LLSQEEVLNIFRETGALLSGHFLLSSGRHSPVYFQCALVFQHPQHAECLGAELASRFAGLHVDLIISPAVGGIVVGQEVGRALGVRAIFAERESGKMRLRRGFGIEKGERALVVEDVMTTGGSTGEVIGVVQGAGGEVVGVGVVVDRSGENVGLDVSLKSLARLEALTYLAGECPLCRDKVPLVKPGSREGI
jgi:orotate phosphoribosyltransferase